MQQHSHCSHFNQFLYCYQTNWIFQGQMSISELFFKWVGFYLSVSTWTSAEVILGSLSSFLTLFNCSWLTYKTLNRISSELSGNFFRTSFGSKATILNILNPDFMFSRFNKFTSSLRSWGNKYFGNVVRLCFWSFESIKFSHHFWFTGPRNVTSSDCDRRMLFRTRQMNHNSCPHKFEWYQVKMA